MNKITLIIKREYLTRVRKKSFLIMTILGPILMAALFIVPVYVAQLEDEVKTVAIIDDSDVFSDAFQSTANVNFIHLDQNVNDAKENLDEKIFDVLLYVPRAELNVPQKAFIYSSGQPSMSVKSVIKNQMTDHLKELKLEASGIDKDVLESIKSNVYLATIRLNEAGEEKTSSTELSMILGGVAGFLIYIFIFIYGAQVMRGVIEEKTSRIVEVIVSSVKPFQLMMGKITGVALVGLTQFTLWVILTFGIVTIFSASYSDELTSMRSENYFSTDRIPTEVEGMSPDQDISQAKVARIFKAFESISFSTMIFSFLFFFIGGYLLYGAFFAAIGSAVDSEADTQQFMMPITIPLILSIVLAQFIINNPDGPVAFWLSIIPLTSPVVMMIRIPFGVPFVELLLSYVLLILGFLGAVWLAAKIYRTGILMYGKKINYRELWKWIRYSNG